jgi:hypothetical protein
MFWFLGVYARMLPLFQNTSLIYFEMLKSSQRKICVYIFTCYVHVKSFDKKLTYLLSSVKKQNLVIKIDLFVRHVLSYYTDHTQKNRILAMLYERSVNIFDN